MATKDKLVSLEVLKNTTQADVNDLKSAVSKYQNGVVLVNNIAPIVTEGYLINSASAGSAISINSNSDYGYVKIPVKPSTKYAINMDISANFSWWAYESSDPNGTSISKVSVDSNHIATSPSNANILYIAISGGTSSTGLVVLEQDTSIYGATTTTYPRSKVVAVDIPLLRDDGGLTEEINGTLTDAMDYTWEITNKSKELINLTDVTDNYYVKASDGTTAQNNSFAVTDYIHVLPNALYRVIGGASGSQVAFYDKDKVFIPSSGVVLNANRNIATPDGAHYLRWCSSKSNKSNYSMYLTDTYWIDYTEKLLVGLQSAYSAGIAKVEVAAGSYDVISEYTTKYGESYFSNYTSNYNGLANGNFDRGLWLDHIKITFDPGAKVVCKYEPDSPNTNVRSYFSAFAIGTNVEIDGLVLDAKNLRYGIHPDFNGSTTDRTYVIIKNCDLKHIKDTVGNYSQAVGAGLGIHSDWHYENCIFRSEDGKMVVRIHNNSNAGAQSSITFDGCYIDGSGYIQLNAYGTSTVMTDIRAHGCSWETAPVIGIEDGGTVQNMSLTAWNNETRE